MVQVLVELTDLPTATVYDRMLKAVNLPEADAQQAATEAVKAQQKRIEAEQARLSAILQSAPFSAVELYRVQRAMNAITISIPVDNIAEVRKLAGVKKVSLLSPESSQPPAQVIAAPQAPARNAARLGSTQAQAADITVQLPSGTASTSNETVQFLVELEDPPAARVYAEALNRAGGAANTGARSSAVSAARASLTKIASAQLRVGNALRGQIGAQEIYRVQKSFNGIAIRVSVNQLNAIRRLPGVKDVHPLVQEYPTNSTSVPFLGTPQLWGNTLGVGSLTGAGVKIGIIDTGIDYQHANFGGSGLLSDYQANDRSVAPDSYYPTAKVVGGYDFAGDAYNGSNAPTPDADPMDCNGHGSHVAGTAAGYGVTTMNTTFAGPFDTMVPFASLKLGPGVAPQAQLYALRVFGCGGSTNLTVQAIDWAIDPNGDNDFSDHLDVINMSLGSSFGTPSSTSSVAAENAALAGVSVVASAGNSGDTYFISGSPGSSARTLTVAASADSGGPASNIQVNAPGGIAGAYVAGPASFGPPPPVAGITADVVLALDPSDGAGVLTTDGCSALTNAAAVAGKIALIDRGTCGFSVKVKNAQNAGAVGVLIANTAAGVFGGLGGADATITIPSVMVTFADGNTFKSNIVGLNVSLLSGADTLGSFSSRGARIGSPRVGKPDIAAPGVSITSSQTGVTCTGTAPSSGCQVPNASGFIPDSQTLTISGTSMAAPHIAGVIALLRQQHPFWTVEELKALAMNTALHNVTVNANGIGPVYGVGRVGAGRVDPVLAAGSDIVAFNAEESGSVGLSFYAETVGSSTQLKKIRVVNKGTTSVTYDLAVDTTVDAPGIGFSLPGGASVTIPAQQAVEFDVQMSATANQMDHAREASVSATQVAPGPVATLGTLARQFVTEESAYLNFNLGAATKLRLPLHAAPRPASMMSAPATIATGGAASGSTTIPLSGQDICTGTLGAGPTCSGTFPNDVVSLVTPFELQVTSPLDPINAPDFADIKNVGVAYSTTSGQLMFGISSYGNFTTLNQVTYNIYIDSNEDGTWDRILFNSNPGTLSTLLGNSQSAQDIYLNAVFNLATNGVSVSATNFVNRIGASAADTALFNNNVLFLTATPTQLGFSTGDTTFRYKVVSCPGNAPLCKQINGFQFDEAAGPYFWNYSAQGLDFAGSNLIFDLNGATLPLTWNTANMTTNGSLGALLLHHHNTQGKRDEIVLLDTAQHADLAITKSVNVPNPSFGQNVTFTLNVTNNGPDTASGIVIADILPSGLTYVSDNGGGAYDSVTGLWTVPGTLANAASVSLQITATVNTTDAIVNTASITSSSPLDTVPGNNQSTVTLSAPRSADLALAMSVSSPTVLVGDPVTYTLTVTNTGTDPAHSLNVNEAFAAFPALNPTSFTASQGIYNPATGLWNFASLGNGASATLSVTFTAPNMAGALTNNGSAASGTSDPNNANNTATATTNVLSPATVSATKTVAGTFVVGTNVTYTVVLSNSSKNDQQDNPGNEFNDVLPSGVTLVSASASSGTAVATIATNTVTWNGVVPGNNGTVTITINATINTVGGAIVTNQGNVSYDADGNGANEAAALTDDPALGGATDPTSFTVQVGTTATAIVSDLPDPTVFGQSYAVTFSVSVLTGSGTPTGNVTVSDGTNSCTATVAAGSCVLPSTSVGAQTLTAVYAGDINFSGSTSASAPHIVNKANTTTTIVSDLPDASVIAQSYTVVFNVIAVSPGVGTPTGNVTVSDGTNSCTATVAVGSCVLPSTSVGAKSLTATYDGDANFNNSVSVVAPHTVNKADTTTMILSDTPDPTVAGQSYTVAASVTVNPPGAANKSQAATAAVTGTITVSDGTNSCVITLPATSCSLTSATGGTKTLVATYSGDANFNGSVSAGTTHTVNSGDYPDTSAISDQKPGSVLVYPIYSSSASNASSQNTRFSITNTNPNRNAFVHLFFVDGSSCSVADSYICLTPNQTASLLASDVDPGTTGYLIAVAVDAAGCPINFNHLIGDEFVKLASGHQSNLGAEAIAAIAGGLPACNPAIDNNAVLAFNNVSYNALPRVLASSNVPSRADGNDTYVVINRIGGNLSTAGSAIGGFFGILYDDAEAAYSFSLAASACQSAGSITNDRPRVVPRFETVIPSGRSGWFKVWGASDIGILGAQINRNSNAGTNAAAFNHGHNLHKLTYTTSATITIPVFPPSC